MKNKKILIVAAHPDDEVLGCGGTVAKMAVGGAEIFCLFMGQGKSSRYGAGSRLKMKEDQNVLKKEARDAAKILGINKMFFEDFPDQKYDTVPFLDLVQSIEKIKNMIKPDIVFTHHGGDLNMDHELTLRAALTATRPLPGERVKAIYSFEIPSSTEWGLHSKEGLFFPNVFVDISDVFYKKIKAIMAYKSENRGYPHPRSPESLEIIAKHWGTVAGVEKAEALILIRELK